MQIKKKGKATDLLIMKATRRLYDGQWRIVVKSLGEYFNVMMIY